MCYLENTGDNKQGSVLAEEEGLLVGCCAEIAAIWAAKTSLDSTCVYYQNYFQLTV